MSRLAWVASAGLLVFAPILRAPELRMPDYRNVIAEVLRIEGGYANIPGDARRRDLVRHLAARHGRVRGRAGAAQPADARQRRRLLPALVDRGPATRNLPISDRLAVQLMLLRVHKDEKVAATMLQIALCTAGQPVTIDGVIGPQTREALRYADEAELYQRFITAAAGWYASRAQFHRFGEAWLRHRLRVQTRR